MQDIYQQLEKFPHDLAGQLLLAQIQAEHLKDLVAAQMTIERILNQPEHTPGNVAAALHQLADSHLRFAKDREGARNALAKIIDLFPGTQFSQMAAQRIAHLPSDERLQEPQNLKLESHPGQYLGLQKPVMEAPQEDNLSAQTARDYVTQLQQHPLDSDAREKLAVIYAEEYKRLDLAAGEIETLLSQPGHGTKRMVRWLNLLADLHLRIGNDVPGAAKALSRIEELFPGSAHAEQANARRANLKMETKRHETQRTIKLGVYEKYKGLKNPPK